MPALSTRRSISGWHNFAGHCGYGRQAKRHIFAQKQLAVVVYVKHSFDQTHDVVNIDAIVTLLYTCVLLICILS